LPSFFHKRKLFSQTYKSSYRREAVIYGKTVARTSNSSQHVKTHIDKPKSEIVGDIVDHKFKVKEEIKQENNNFDGNIILMQV